MTDANSTDETDDSGSDIDADLHHRDLAGMSSEESTEDGQPFEVLLPVTDLNWEWPCYEEWFGAGRWHTRGKAKEEVEEKWPFDVITRFDGAGQSSNFVRLYSSFLIEIVEKCLPHATQLSKGERIDVKRMFLAREGLRKFLGDEGTTGETVDIEVGQCHARHFLRFLEREFKDTLVQYELMKWEGRVSWDMLWTFFVPGEAVVRRCQISDQQCYAIVKGGVYGEAMDGRCCFVDLNVMDYNIESYHKCTLKDKIEKFDGEVPFTSLKVCPMYFFPERGAIEDKIRKMGDGFYRLAMAQPFSFMHFTGSMNFVIGDGNWGQLKKLNADGRVMIDLLSFARMNPGYALGNAQPPYDVLTGWSSSQNNRQARKKPDAEELKFAPAIVYGFSFRLEQWGCFEVSGFRDIAFKDGAFESLVMRSENQKQLLFRLVEQYVGVDEGGQATATDPIPKKGDGCIILCHGPPGTGKTLTAEALAETLHRPLWAISAFELGSTPADVETTLNQILDIAWTWRAILLLDEADAYLERRKEGLDVSRNMTTGVFLSLLEYYCGVMFLTTNRVTAFDEAILSRMSLTVRYPPLDDTQRLQIWRTRTLLSRVGLPGAPCEALLQHYFNGREIRNIVRLAQTWARSCKQALHIQHVCDAMEVVAESSPDLPTH